MQTYDFCKQLFVDVYGSVEEMQDIIYAGIVDYNGATPYEVCAQIVKEANTQGIGLTGAEIVAVITAVLTFLGTIIAAICSSVAQTNIAKYGALDKEVVNSSTPDASDFDGLSMSSSGDWTKYLPILAIAVGAYVILKN